MVEEFTLYELNQLISAAVSRALPDTYKVAGEISELRENSSGHCYMELIQKNSSGVTIARARANIWANTYRKLRPFFEHSTGIRLSSGIKIMIEARVNFDPLYHYSLVVTSIFPEYTLGDIALRRAEILNRLKEDGIADDNKQLELSTTPQRIAVISSATAAGYGDFCDQLKNNSGGFVFYPVLFKAVMQGERSAQSIIDALTKIHSHIDMFDCVVIIRGGGATSELNCFDDYELALHIAQYPLPVIVGIGHERDTTVLDYIANKSLKTPTAVAEFLISVMDESMEELRYLSSVIVNSAGNTLSKNKNRIELIQERIRANATTRIEREKSKLSIYRNKISIAAQQLVTTHKVGLATTKVAICNNISRVLEREKNRLALTENNITLLSPDTILKRGYTLTVKDGYVIKSFSDINKEDNIDIIFADGEVSAKVEKVTNYEG